MCSWLHQIFWPILIDAWVKSGLEITAFLVRGLKIYILTPSDPKYFLISMTKLLYSSTVKRNMLTNSDDPRSFH